MHNLFIKRIKKRRKLFIRTSFIFFIMFSTLNILFVFCWNFFGQIFLYSFGYNDNHYYSQNVVSYQTVENYFPKDDIALSYDIENHVEDRDIIFSAFCTPNTFQKNYGIKLSLRLFVNIDVNDKKAIENNKNKNYCIVSDNFKNKEDSFSVNGKEFPVVTTFKLNMTSAIIDSLKSSNIDDIQLVLFVENKIDEDTSFNVILNGHEALASRFDFKSGKELNNEYKTGYTAFEPLIYIGFLIPYLFAIISMFFIVSNMQAISLKENSTLYLLGMKRKDIFSLILKERILETLLGFITSIIIFTPIFIPITKNFFYVSFINYVIQLIYVIIILAFYTLKETKRRIN